MKRYADQGKVDTRSGFGAGCVPRAVKRGISNVCMIFLLSLTASCTLCNTLESILSLGRKELNWTLEYELNGETFKDTRYYRRNWENSPLNTLTALKFWWDDDFYQEKTKHSSPPLNILMSTPDLFFYLPTMAFRVFG